MDSFFFGLVSLAAALALASALDYLKKICRFFLS
jgi:hypothetical protein